MGLSHVNLVMVRNICYSCSMPEYVVKTPIFEGPLELLLSLIEKRKLHINDISLAKVADDYITHIKELPKFPMGEAAHFILIASTLLLIKSKSLLPALTLTEEEQGSIEDLERRLKLYQRIRELSLHVKESFGKDMIFYPRERAFTPVFSPDNTMTLESISSSINEILKRLPKKEFLPKTVVAKVISLEEMIESLTGRIQSSLKLSFKEFAKIGKAEKTHIIVSFLAMLELVKQGIVNVVQENHFDDIVIETEKVGVPHY